MGAAGPLSDPVLEARKQQVRAKIEATRMEVRTYRDTLMEMDLTFYFLKVETDRVNLQRRKAGSGEIPDSAFGGSTKEIRSKLHRELD